MKIEEYFSGKNYGYELTANRSLHIMSPKYSCVRVCTATRLSFYIQAVAGC